MDQTADNSTGLLAALDRGESLPARWYTDPAITEQEIQHVFRKSWNYIGPLGELTNLGDYITGYAGGRAGRRDPQRAAGSPALSMSAGTGGTRS